MKRIRFWAVISLCLLLCAGCGAGDAAGTEQTAIVPDAARIKSDIQDYVTEILDENATVFYFETSKTEEMENVIIYTNEVEYGDIESSDSGADSFMQFVVTYTLESNEWVLSKISVHPLEIEMTEESSEESVEETAEEAVETETPMEEVSDEISYEKPEYLSSYVAASEIGDSLDTKTVELDGVIYTLPAPLSVFEENGWELTCESETVDEIVEAQEWITQGVSLIKGDIEVSVNIKNFSDKATVPPFCAVNYIMVREDDGVSFVLPGGITFGLSNNDLMQNYPVIYQYFHYDMDAEHFYNAFDFTADHRSSFTVNKELDRVTYLQFGVDTWHYE